MSVLRRIVLGAAFFAAALLAGAQRPAEALTTEDALFQIVAYYNPTLAEAQPLVHCVAQGTNVSSCGQQFLQGEALQDPNVQRMLQVMDAYKGGRWGEVISLAGVGVACAWIDNPPVVCSAFAQVLVDVGAQAVTAQIEVANAVVQIFGDTAKTVGCWTGIYCDDDDDEPANQYNAGAEWNRCFKPRVQEGVIARLYGGDGYSRLIRRQTASHRFSSSSLIGACYPWVATPDIQISTTLSASMLRSLATTPAPLPGPSVPFTDAWNTANPWGAPPPNAATTTADTQTMFADFIAFATPPLSTQYEEIVEQGALASLETPSLDYVNLQGIWNVRAVSQGMTAFVELVETRGQMISLSLDGRASRQRSECFTALSTPDAHILDRWADTGARIHSTSAINGLSAANWTERSPAGWCDNTYVPTFRAEAQRRLTAYDHALAQGCTIVRDDRFSLACPLIGGGMGNCQTAFQGIQRGHCTRATLAVRVIPQTSVPPATETPPPAVETAPAPAQQRQPEQPSILRPPPRRP